MAWRNLNGNAVQKAIEVCNAVKDGDFEARITNYDTNTEFGTLYQAINDMIDRTDAYVRESKASLEYVSRNKYFRRISEKGMLGAFLHASQTVNGAMSAMDERVSNFSTVIARFEGVLSTDRRNTLS